VPLRVTSWLKINRGLELPVVFIYNIYHAY
jgi:hypothetical protein